MAAPPNDSPIGRPAGAPGRARASPGAPSRASPRSAARSRTRRASSAAASSSWLIRSADARRSWTSSSIAGSRIASASAASSVRPSSRSPVRRRTASASSRVASSTRRSAGAETTGSACSTRRSASSGAFDASAAAAASIENRAARVGVAGCERVLGEHRQAGRGRVAAVEQEVDHRGVDLPAPGGRQLARRELANLLVGERVVGRARPGPAGAGGRPDGRAEIVGQRIGPSPEATPSFASAGGSVAVAPPRGPAAGSIVPVADARPDRLQVAEAEAASEDRRVAQDGPGPGRAAAPRAGRSASGPPMARVGRRSGPSRHSPSICWSVPASRWVRASSSTMNGTPSDWACIAAADDASTGPPRTRFRSSAVSTEPNRPGRSRRTRPIRSMSATKFTASRDGRELVGADRQQQEDRPVGVAPDGVPEQAQRVVVGPLDVVDEERQRPHPASVAMATPARSNARSSLASGDRRLEPGLVAARRWPRRRA